MPTLTIAKRIRRAREAKGWSRATLARVSGIHPATITTWERGQFKPSPIYRRLVEQILDVDLSEPTDPPKAVTFDITIGIEGGNGGKAETTK